MKKKIVLLLVFIAIFAAGKIPYRIYSPRLLNHFVEQAAMVNIHLQAKEFNLTFPFRAKAKEVSAYLPVEGFPVPAYCKEVNYRLSIPSLFLFKVLNLADANCYDSKLNLSTSQKFFSPKTDIEAKGESIQLYNHPLAKGFGIMGDIDFNAMGTVNEDLPEKMEKAQGELKIANGTYIGGFKIKGLFPIPSVKDLNADVAFAYGDKTLVVDKLKLESSLASGSGSARVDILNPRQYKKAVFRFNLDLTDKGVKEFGEYFALATRKQSDKHVKRWKIKLESKLRSNGRGYKASYNLTPR